MKKIFPIMLVLMLLLWGCSKEEPQQVSSPPESAGTENAAESTNDGGIRLMGMIIQDDGSMSGYMMMTSALGANIRDWTPAGKAGHFQGIRMIFAVLLPMVTGPAIGAAVIKNGASTYVELGQEKTVPTPGIYLAAAAVLLLTFVPILVLRRKEQ